jgi:hypothetical protein
MTIRRFWAEMSPSQRREFVLTMCILLFTIINAAATIVYVSYFKGSVEENSGQTGKLISAASVQASAATKIAKASSDFSTSANGIESHLGQAVIDFQTAAKDSTNASKIAAKNAETNIRNAQESFKQEQRAWVGLQNVGPVSGLTDTEPLKAQINFFNSGRTPARNVQFSAKFMTSPTAIAEPPKEGLDQLLFTPVQSIPPQGGYHPILGADTLAQVASQSQRHGQEVLISQYKAIKEKTLFLYFYGIVKYDDIFGNHRETQWCIFLANPDTREMGICDAFNDLN